MDSAGALHVHTSLGDLVDDAPYIYQDVGGVRVPVAGAYRLVDSNTYGFQVTGNYGNYDTTKPLVIDPDLSWSTFLGGSSLEAGTGIAVDASGNVYVTGYTQSADFPTKSGAPYPSLGSDSSVLVTKLYQNGSGLFYSTYVGGARENYGHAIAIDVAGGAYVTGYTNSPDFPVTFGAFQETYKDGGADAFAFRLDPFGNRLEYSTFLGGTAGSDIGSAVVVDSCGAAYVTGYTDSTDYPTTPGAYETAHKEGGWDAAELRRPPLRQSQ